MVAKKIKTFKTLIRLHEDKLNGLRRKINDLDTERSNLNKSLTELVNQAVIEANKYTGSEYAFILDTYLKHVENSRKRLLEQIYSLDYRISQLQLELSAQFAELKKFEIAQQNRVNIYQEKARQAETKFFDELNVTKINSKSS